MNIIIAFRLHNNLWAIKIGEFLKFDFGRVVRWGGFYTGSRVTYPKLTSRFSLPSSHSALSTKPLTNACLKCGTRKVTKKKHGSETQKFLLSNHSMI